MKQPSTLWQEAAQFRARLSEIKQDICLLAGQWYPYDSMSAMAHLDQLLDGDLQALRELLGTDPVLDIGCSDGDVAFFLESLGCGPVRAIDYPPTSHNWMYGVTVMKQALGSTIEIQAADLDQQFQLPEPRYGLACLLGILYHLKNPYAILETLAKNSRYCFLSTRVAAFAPDRKTRLNDLPIAYLLDEGEINNDETNYWIFSETGLRRILARAGWNVCHWKIVGNTSVSDPVSSAGDARAFCILESRLTTLGLLDGWHQLENKSWRWTRRRFSVELAGRASGMLRFRFHVPPQLAAVRPAVTLAATVNGMALSSQSYSGAGEREYACPIPPSAATARPMRIKFELDHALQPSSLDQRELGVLVDFSVGPPIQIA